MTSPEVVTEVEAGTLEEEVAAVQNLEELFDVLKEADRAQEELEDRGEKVSGTKVGMDLATGKIKELYTSDIEEGERALDQLRERVRGEFDEGNKRVDEMERNTPDSIQAWDEASTRLQREYVSDSLIIMSLSGSLSTMRTIRDMYE